MWILGGFILVYFGLSLISMMMVTPEQYHAQMQMLVQHGFPANDSGMSETTPRTTGKVFGLLGTVLGITIVSLAFGVRRSRRGSTIASVVLMSGIAILVGLFALGSVAAGLIAPIFFAAAILLMCLLVPMVMLVVWLIAALRTPVYAAVPPAQWSAYAAPQPTGWVAYPPSPSHLPAPPAPQSTLGYGYPGLTPPPPPSMAQPSAAPVVAPAPPSDPGTAATS
jgi:hypothetical protein